MKVFESPHFKPRLSIRKAKGKVFYTLFLSAVIVGILGLIVLLAQVLQQGLPWFDWGFITSYPSRHPEQAGLKSALFGTLWVMGITALFTIPLGVGAAIHPVSYTHLTLPTSDLV